MRSIAPQILALSVGALGAAVVCEASPVSIRSSRGSSTAGQGSFTGSLDYTPLSATSGSLIVRITNTSEESVGGFLTALAFNVNSSDTDRRAMMFFGPHNWNGHMHMDAEPFGTHFDGGAASFQMAAPFGENGQANRGLGVGETGIFDFMIHSDDAGELTSADFILGGPGVFNFVVRFHAFAGGGGDAVPAEVASMPLPSAALMGMAAMAGLLSHRRRR